jgi:SAM-dependent methyltransferase
VRSEDEALVRQSAERLYGAGQKIWDPTDRWNQHKRECIDIFARSHIQNRMSDGLVLDAGCGNEGYSWLPSNRICLDRFTDQLARVSHAVVGDLELLPFRDSTFGFVVCVASVLNYVSAAEAIIELGRITRTGGWLLLHFETSSSLEHALRAYWRSSATHIRTINSGREDDIWIYRPSYIQSLLSASGYVMRAKKEFHILSALGLRLGLRQQMAARLSKIDALAYPLRRFSDDVILLAEKSA